ncbi:MAG: hypothetical protein IPP55_08890 [Anaerolineales bacterium]|nr:hypothetical protein [Anaerolineales bacterium]
MKKTCLFVILVCALFFLTGCAPRFPQVSSYYIAQFELTDKEKRLRTSLVLNPDGNTVLIGNDYVARLESGEKEDLHLYGIIDKDSHDILDDSGFWSFDGHYLGMLAQHYEASREPVGYATYIFDLRDNTFRRYEIRATSFSPFNSDQVLTDKGVYNLNDGTIIPLLPDYDFSQDKNFGGTMWAMGVLWSQKLGAPVAQLSISSSSKENHNVVLESLNINDPVHPKYSIPIGFSFQSPDWAIYRLLDPTGEYALIVQWKCSKDLAPCATIPVNTDSVYDTVLTLVRWRTGEQKELIRLSEIDPKNAVAYGYMAWSADGSTIFISRKDAQPIVIKLK